MKRAIPIIILLCLMTVFIPVSGSDASGADDGLWVNGEHVTGGVTRETWSYDAASNTLALNGVTFNVPHTDSCSTGIFDPNNSSPIYDGRGDSTLKIVLTGENEILPGAGSSDTYTSGIFSINNVEISGTGSLHIHGGEYNNGISADQHLVINGGTITIDEIAGLGTDVYIPNRAFSDDSGFTMKSGTLNLSGNGDLAVYGKIYIQGGAINTVCNYDDGFLALDTGYQDGVFDMSGGTLTFTNTIAGQILAKAHPFEVLTKIVMNLHEAPLTNVIQSDNTLRSMDAGVAIIGGPTFEVKFDANEGTCDTPSAMTDWNGKLASLPDATRDGYKFDGWFTEKDGGDNVTASTVLTKDCTLYAHWGKESSGNNDNLALYIGIGVAAAVLVAAVGAAFFFKRR